MSQTDLNGSSAVEIEQSSALPTPTASQTSTPTPSPSLTFTPSATIQPTDDWPDSIINQSGWTPGPNQTVIVSENSVIITSASSTPTPGPSLTPSQTRTKTATPSLTPVPDAQFSWLPQIMTPPNLASSLGGQLTGFVVGDQYVYAFIGETVTVVDMTSNENKKAEILYVLPIPNRVHHYERSGNFLYLYQVVAGVPEIWVIDLSGPIEIRPVAKIYGIGLAPSPASGLNPFDVGESGSVYFTNRAEQRWQLDVDPELPAKLVTAVYDQNERDASAERARQTEYDSILEKVYPEINTPYFIANVYERAVEQDNDIYYHIPDGFQTLGSSLIVKVDATDRETPQITSIIDPTFPTPLEYIDMGDFVRVERMSAPYYQLNSLGPIQLDLNNPEMPFIEVYPFDVDIPKPAGSSADFMIIDDKSILDFSDPEAPAYFYHRLGDIDTFNYRIYNTHYDPDRSMMVGIAASWYGSDEGIYGIVIYSFANGYDDPIIGRVKGNYLGFIKVGDYLLATTGLYNADQSKVERNGFELLDISNPTEIIPLGTYGLDQYPLQP
ncbi:MAG: hypothetical protein AAF633_16695, partial [Chloroflexota bacterium]